MSSDHPNARPEPTEETTPPSGVELIIRPRRRDLGGFEVARVLPHAKKRMVGPFIFLDEMGPAAFAPGEGIDVRPHPHIGLATVTYLFDGEIRHRDSLGFDQIIRPGDVNWMIAGRGVTHSERTDPSLREAGHRLHGIQSWVALPENAERVRPEFHHHAGDGLPDFETKGARMRVIAGRAFGQTSPVNTFSPMFYVHAEAPAGAEVQLPDDYSERAFYVVDGRLSVNGTTCGAGELLVVETGAAPRIQARTDSRIMLLGGDPVGPRLIWWNFVGSSERLIDEAKTNWSDAAGAGFKGTAFALPPGETEFIPLP
ncbi:MAG: pirin family protein [Alphaproteobacteria bacterium]|nr:pirin family protein [Alphaproteobacteria bacterium]